MVVKAITGEIGRIVKEVRQIYQFGMIMEIPMF